MGSFRWQTFVVAAVCFLLLYIPRWFPKQIPRWVPVPFMVMALAVVLSYFLNLQKQGVEIVGTLPHKPPMPTVPTIHKKDIGSLISGGFVVAIISYMGSLGLAKNLASQSAVKYTINSDQELVAYSMANIAGCFFKAFPCSASFSRSALNFEMGASTPMHGLFTGVILLVAIYASKTFYYLPKATLSAVILISIIRLVKNGFKELVYLGKNRSLEFFECFVCLVAVCFVGILYGLIAGAATSLLVHIYKTSFGGVDTWALASSSDVGMENFYSGELTTQHLQELAVVKPTVMIYYGNAQRVSDAIRSVKAQGFRGLVCSFQYSYKVDSTSVRLIMDTLNELSFDAVAFSDTFGNVHKDFIRFCKPGDQAGLLDSIRFFRHVDDAIDSVREDLAGYIPPNPSVV